MSLSLFIFIALYLGGIFLTICADISWGIALYELLYFIYPASRWWYTLPQFRYTFVLAIVFIIAFFFRKKTAGISVGKSANFPQEKWLLAMIAMMGVISTYAVWPEEHYRFSILQVQQLVFMYIAYRVVDTDEKLERVVWAFLAGCFYVGYIAQSMPRDMFGRLEGIGMPDGPDANTTAAVLVTAIPLLLHYLLTGRHVKRIAALLFFPFVANAVILLNSRGAFLALVIAVALQIFAVVRKKIFTRQQRLFGIFIAMGCLGLFLYLTDATFWARMASLREVDPGEGGATRVNFWIAAIDLVRQHPFGLGARGFEFMSPTILPEEWLTTTGTITVHSTYMQALVDFGYAGAVILGGFIVTTFLQARKIKKVAGSRRDVNCYSKALAFEASFIAFLVSALFIDRLYAEAFYWLMLFVAMFTRTYLASAGQDLDGCQKEVGKA